MGVEAHYFFSTLDECAPLSEQLRQMKSGTGQLQTFNQLLREEGIDPADVALLRHQTFRNGRTPYWLWRNDRDGFLRYQSTQQNLPIFRKPYWASFVSPDAHKTMFVGLYRTEFQPHVNIDWPDPLTGMPVGYGRDRTYHYFHCEPTTELNSHVGSMMIEWGDSRRQWTQYAARSDKSIIELVPSSSRAERNGDNSQPNLQQALRSAGLEPIHRTQKVTMFRDDAGVVVYLKNESHRCPLVIHPYHDVIRSQFEALPGIAADSSRDYYINSNLAAFPVYQNDNRATTSRFGIALEVTDTSSIPLLVNLLRTHRSINTPDGPVDIGDSYTPETTEREALQLSRIGQGRFRTGCNQLWNWRCALTGVAIQEVLRASHIKAWSKSTNGERLDPYNGLLLAAHIDALFDRHLISFCDEGMLLISGRVSPDDLVKLGIDPERAQLNRVHERHKPYLAQHRSLLQP